MNRLRLLQHLSSQLCSFQQQRCGMSTVFALSSGHGKCGVGVVRISGEAAATALIKMTASAKLPIPRRAELRSILHPSSKCELDRGLVLWFPAPHSFTGEDSAELHVHGGPAVLSAVLQALQELPGYRHALPGEFTRRAFSRGKLDLTGVEGLADLINAETEAQRRQALRQCRGHLGQLYGEWRRLLLEARARIEAHLDFGEEGHEQIPDVSGQVGRRVREVARAMTRHLRDGRRGELVRGGVRLAILGRPNAGKSTCLNALLRRPAAIVSPIPGTTRDVVSGTLDLAGFPVQVLDTAGLRRTQDLVEWQGVARALDTARDAHAALLVLDARDVLDTLVLKGETAGLEPHPVTGSGKAKSPLSHTITVVKGGTCEERPESLEGGSGSSYMFNVDEFINEHLDDFSDDISDSRLSEMEWFAEGNFVILINKIDLISSSELSVLERISFIRNNSSDGPSKSTLECGSKTGVSPLPNKSQNEGNCVAACPGEAATVVPVSLTRGDRLDGALQALEVLCGRLCAADGLQEEAPTLTTARHRTHVTAALRSLLAVTGEGEALLAAKGDTTSVIDSENDQVTRLAHCSGKVSMRTGEREEFVSDGECSLLESEATLVAAAHYLHQATRHLGHVTGHVTSEHVLDQIFKEFCIGK